MIHVYNITQSLILAAAVLMSGYLVELFITAGVQNVLHIGI